MTTTTSPLRAVSRREFIRIATAAAGAAASLGLPGCGFRKPPQTDAGASAGGFDLPSLGGAPDTSDGRAIAAFCDTVVPGAHRDPNGAPGAIDVGAVAPFFDPALPAAPLVPLLVFLLDSKAQEVVGVPFVGATPAEREQVLERALADVVLLDFAVQLAKLAYFTSAGGTAHLGYRGANAGYVDHPDFSFGVAMATEITTDGNLP